MKESIKNYLGITIIIGILFFSVAAVFYVYSFSKSIEPTSFRSFSVSGNGKTTAIPDVAQFTFSVITEGGKDIGGLQQENTDKANKVIEFVKSQGIDIKDIKTQDYNLEPRYQYFNCFGQNGPCPPPEIVGYKITQTVLVKVRDFKKIGDIFSGVITQGANSVSQLSFRIDDPTEFQNQARKEAIEKAKQKAKSVAEAGGFRLGRLLSIEEGYVPLFYGEEMLGRGGGTPLSAPAPTIEPGSQEVTVSVILKYEID